MRCNIAQISTGVAGSGDIYCTLVPTTYCPPQKVTPETLYSSQGPSDLREIWGLRPLRTVCGMNQLQ